MVQKKLTVGTRVMWHDPDEELCSGPGVISRMDKGSEVILVLFESGSEFEVFPRELEVL